MAKQLEKITPREEDFAQWYTDVVKNAGLVEYGPVKGTIIFKPYGYAIWENIQKIVDLEFKKIGIQNVYFPLLIPESLFNKEKDHIEGFSPEILTVTHVGDKKLPENLFIRPTSEVLFMEYFQKEVQSYRDLPMLLNQWCNIMRWEKTTRPFLRTSEFLWQEGHTIHNSPEDALKMTMTILQIYEKFVVEKLMLPVIAGKKTEKEKFAGALETYTIESLMYDGQALQCGTSHFFGDNFTKVYDIKFQNKDGKLENAYSTSWGISTRLIGGIIMTHSDDSGLVLPSSISPFQVALIPVNDSSEVMNCAETIKNDLSDLRVEINRSDKSFGFKISEAEIRGIPVRVEIGPRDLKEGQVTISRRDNREKITVPLAEVNTTICQMLIDYDQALYTKALANRQKRTSSANSIEEYKQKLDQNGGFVLVPFCGQIDCETDVKQQTSTNSRCIPFDVEQTKGKCFNCQKDSNLRVYFGRAY